LNLVERLSVMSDLKRTAAEAGIVTLVNIHDVNLARVFADRIAGIAGGKIVFDGPPTALDEAAMARVYQGSAAAFAMSDSGGYANREGDEPEPALTLAEREAIEAAERLP
jgi:ABC-type phosphate/phosphonate transport system ATPase subunit